MQNETATFGAGCFWCAEAAYKLLDGVERVASGYAGGEKENPSYEEVSTGATGYVEAVQIEYDAQKVAYEDLLKIFWEIHDPEQENRQGPDVGTEYQAVIFYHNEEQKRVTQESKEKVEQEKNLRGKVMTQIKPFTSFYPAEDYHKDYFEKNPNSPYSQIVIVPKLEKAKKVIERLKNE